LIARCADLVEREVRVNGAVCVRQEDRASMYGGWLAGWLGCQMYGVGREACERSEGGPIE